MFFDFTDYVFYLRPGKTDMRKRSSSLTFIIQDEMKLNPFDKAVFLFCSGNHTILRAVVWEKNGFWEISKKFEAGTICWAKDEAEAKVVSIESVKNMLQGQNPWRKIVKLNPSKVC